MNDDVQNYSAGLCYARCGFCEAAGYAEGGPPSLQHSPLCRAEMHRKPFMTVTSVDAEKGIVTVTVTS